MSATSQSPISPPRGTVFKFGGTSMGSPERIARVADLCLKHRPMAVVVSAMSGETNRLIALGKEMSLRTDVPEYDLLVASGEQVSVALLSLALRERGLNPAPMLAPHAGILTDDLHSRASILRVEGDGLQKALSVGQMPVIAGFQGVTSQGQITSLGRGGSDTSAVAIAAGLRAESCVIYTDVDGVYTADPRLVPAARIIPRIRSEEMLEMASQGSKVLHIRSVHLAAKWGIRLIVRNTFNDSEGTEMISDDTLEGEVVTGVASTTGEAWLTLGPLPPRHSLLAEVFGVLAQKGINVDIIGQNFEPMGVSLNFTVGGSDASLAKETLAHSFPGVPLSVRLDVGKVSIVGVGMRTHPGVAARFFDVLAQLGIEVLLVTTSEIKVACLVESARTGEAVRALHVAFLES